MFCSDGFTYSTHSNTWIGPISIFSNRYDTEYDTDVFLRYRHRYQYCDVTKLTGMSRDLVDQVQGCLTLWTLVVVQYFLSESTTQIDKSKILKIFQFINEIIVLLNNTRCTAHDSLPSVMTRRVQALEIRRQSVDRSRAVSKASILLDGIDIFRSGLGIFGIEYLVSISAHPLVANFSSSCPKKFSSL